MRAHVDRHGGQAQEVGQVGEAALLLATRKCGREYDDGEREWRPRRQGGRAPRPKKARVALQGSGADPRHAPPAGTRTCTAGIRPRASRPKNAPYAFTASPLSSHRHTGCWKRLQGPGGGYRRAVRRRQGGSAGRRASRGPLAGHLQAGQTRRRLGSGTPTAPHGCQAPHLLVAAAAALPMATWSGPDPAAPSSRSSSASSASGSGVARGGGGRRRRQRAAAAAGPTVDGPLRPAALRRDLRAACCCLAGCRRAPAACRAWANIWRGLACCSVGEGDCETSGQPTNNKQAAN